MNGSIFSHAPYELTCHPSPIEWPHALLVTCLRMVPAGQVDTIGKDPIGADIKGQDPIGKDTKGSDPIGKDTAGNGAVTSPGTSPRPGRSSISTPSTEQLTHGNCTTAADYLSSNPDLSLTKSLFEAAGDVPALSDPVAKAMVFAPTNEAWASAAKGLGLTTQTLTSDPQLLHAIVDYMIVPQLALPTSQWTPGSSVSTLARGERLQLLTPPSPASPNYALQGAQGYAQAQVVEANVPACASYVFIVNAVPVSAAADSLLTAKGLVGSGKRRL